MSEPSHGGTRTSPLDDLAGARPPGRHRVKAPGPSWPGRTGAGRFSRAAAASLVALAGLGILVFGPSLVTVGSHELLQLQSAGEPGGHPVGTQVRDGPVGFVVDGIDCSTDDDRSVHGRWCEVTVTASNDGEEPVTVSGRAQLLHGPDGVRHLPVSGARPFGTLEPGDDATAVIEFDVPLHAHLTHVGLHADPYTDGVRIRITDG